MTLPPKEERLKSMPDVVDWDSDHAGVLKGSLHYEDEHVTVVDRDIEDMAVNIHTHDGEVHVHGFQQRDDGTREFNLELTPKETLLFAEQLAVAANEYAKNDTSADIRT